MDDGCGTLFVAGCSEKPVDLLGLQNHNLSSARHPLTYIPEETVERCTSSPDTFISFLHDNYPCYYPNDLHKVEVGSEWLSLTDCIGGGDWVVSVHRFGYFTFGYALFRANCAWRSCLRWYVINVLNRRDFQNRESTIVYAVSAAVRGLMHLYESDTVSKPFRAIGKPFASVARRKIDERKAIGREIALGKWLFTYRDVHRTTSRFLMHFLPPSCNVKDFPVITHSRVTLKFPRRWLEDILWDWNFFFFHATSVACRFKASHCVTQMWKILLVLVEMVAALSIVSLYLAWLYWTQCRQAASIHYSACLIQQGSLCFWAFPTVCS